MLNKSLSNILMLLIGMVILILTTDTSVAQSTRERVSVIEKQLNAIQRQVFKPGSRFQPPGDDAPAGLNSTAGSEGMLIADINIRISELETQLRQMTGQLEEANYKVSSLSSQIETMKKDYEFRFVEIEGGVGGSTPKVSLGLVLDNASIGISTPKQKYDYAYGLVSNAQYDEAEISLLGFLKDYPENTLAGNAQYWLGQTYYARLNYEDATRTFLEGMKKYPKSQKAPAFILKAGMALNQSGLKNDACDIYRELNARFPDSSENTRLRPVEERKAGCN